jgi:NAD(P) transhydrogenase subunit beta
MITTLINIAYLFGALAFVWGLRLLSSPDTARKGNRQAGIGMGVAILATLAAPGGNMVWILGGLIVGGIIGWRAAMKVAMTDMPQLVSVFNGLGGASAVALAGLELGQIIDTGVSPSASALLILLTTLFIGGVAFTGSILAYLKLDGKVRDEKIILPRHSVINMAFLLVLVVFTAYLSMGGALTWPVLGAYTVLTLIYGFSFVAPIGGADMPVVISLLNSFTGLSAAAAGLIYDNQIMLVGGILVGASGTILTVMMCNAMNRSLLNVLIGGFGSSGATASAAAQGAGGVAKEISLNDMAVQLFYSNKVMVVPGYGLAVAQAQKLCKELDELLEANGVDIKYAIHPVAGRMPGHMNVLLAEVDIPYAKLLDLEEANDELKDTDIVVVVGANDVVNPAAENDPSSSIYGMPVLQVWNAKHVVVLKRSMNPGYAGIENPLFFHEKTKMLFGDAKASLQKLVAEVKAQ